MTGFILAHKFKNESVVKFLTGKFSKLTDQVDEGKKEDDIDTTNKNRQFLVLHVKEYIKNFNQNKKTEKDKVMKKINLLIILIQCLAKLLQQI